MKVSLGCIADIKFIFCGWSLIFLLFPRNRAWTECNHWRIRGSVSSSTCHSEPLYLLLRRQQLMTRIWRRTEHRSPEKGLQRSQMSDSWFKRSQLALYRHNEALNEPSGEKIVCVAGARDEQIFKYQPNSAPLFQSFTPESINITVSPPRCTKLTQHSFCSCCHDAAATERV